MPYQLGLPAALTRFGLQVELVPGWATRGKSAFNPKGSVGHHTAGPLHGDRPSLHICLVGRGGDYPLPGPLCNTFLPRGLTVPQQKVIVVAAGRANHAGLGGYRGLVGNSAVFGTEAESSGTGDWTAWQRWAYPRIVAAHLWLAGHRDAAGARWYCSHRTWTPRKIDPEEIADAWMISQVAPLLEAGHAAPLAGPKPGLVVPGKAPEKPVTPSPVTPSPDTSKDQDMPLYLECIDDPAPRRLFVFDGVHCPEHEQAATAIGELRKAGAIRVVPMRAALIEQLQARHPVRIAPPDPLAMAEKLAAAIVSRLPAVTDVEVPQSVIQDALRAVLGSLNDPPA